MIHIFWTADEYMKVEMILAVKWCPWHQTQRYDKIILNICGKSTRNVTSFYHHFENMLRIRFYESRIIVPRNITLKVSNVIVAETSNQTIRSFIILLSGEGLTSFNINNRTNFLVEKVKWSFSECFSFFENKRLSWDYYFFLH